MKNTNMFVFSDEDIDDIFERLKLSKVKTELGMGIFEKEEQKTCEACKVPIFLENLGHIVHGSKKVYCSNPACFAHYIANNKVL